MAEPPIDVDRIVRDVLAQLAKPDGAASVAAPAEQAAADPPKVDGEVVVASRVVTLDALGGRLKAVRRLVVPPGAVLTPAVRDALRENNVALAFAPTDSPRASGAVGLAMVTAFTSFDPAALVDALASDGINVDASTCDCLIETTDMLASRLREPGVLGLVLTSQVAAALCLANRLPGVRAVLGEGVAETAKATAAVGANLLVVNPKGKSLFQIKQRIVEFCRPGARACPEALRARLA